MIDPPMLRWAVAFVLLFAAWIVITAVIEALSDEIHYQRERRAARRRNQAYERDSRDG